MRAAPPQAAAPAACPRRGTARTVLSDLSPARSAAWCHCARWCLLQAGGSAISASGSSAAAENQASSSCIWSESGDAGERSCTLAADGSCGARGRGRGPAGWVVGGGNRGRARAELRGAGARTARGAGRAGSGGPRLPRAAARAPPRCVGKRTCGLLPGGSRSQGSGHASSCASSGPPGVKSTRIYGWVDGGHGAQRGAGRLGGCVWGSKRRRARRVRGSSGGGARPARVRAACRARCARGPPQCAAPGGGVREGAAARRPGRRGRRRRIRSARRARPSSAHIRVHGANVRERAWLPRDAALRPRRRRHVLLHPAPLDRLPSPCSALGRAGALLPSDGRLSKLKDKASQRV